VHRTVAAARYGSTNVSERRRITLDIKLDGREAESETTCAWVGPYVLVIVTVLSEPGLALDVN
jgi:hypothetical protein